MQQQQFVRAFTLASALSIAALAQPPQPPAGGPPRRQGGFVPGQVRPVGDPLQIARGNGIYGISCRACHGADLRGGDMGGPNLLRSQLSLSDRDGEKIAPIIQNGMQGGMPAIPMSADDAKAVAAYVRSVLGQIGGQGRPPSAQEPPTILVGNPEEGKIYFAQRCASCHSVTGDLKGLAARITDPRMLQNAWVAGGARGRFGGAAPATANPRRTVTATVTTAQEKTEGKLIRIDDFVVTLELADGMIRSFGRTGDVPKVEVNDPLAPHRDMLPLYTDKSIHDVTAFLVTLK